MTLLKKDPRLYFATGLVVMIGVIALAGCGGGGGATTEQNQQGVPAGQTAVKGGPEFVGTEATPAKPAPPIKLGDSLGKQVNLAQYKGKAVLLTFIYTHCPDICPLIVSHLKTVLAELGPKAKNLQIIAVSTDPRGDNPKTVAAFLKAHAMTGKMQYLIGDRKELGKVWTDWNIVVHPAKSGRDLVEHSALIYGINAEGQVVTLYPPNFKPSEIAHDVPLLEE